ncbi:MAG: alpha amylase C-terminal domain-containing protein [Lachnospiraceae bacterium]|nr:alpha amylase C-terminal domain-containing protein [Lachnospiraceae bacterium]
MENKLYKLMNWPEIESIVYSECSNPETILGCHQVPGGNLVQAFFPGADEVIIHDLKTDKEYKAECVDEEGFYAALIPVKGVFNYDYHINSGGKVKVCPEVYKYVPEFWGDLSEKLDAGILYDAYRYFGAHFCERKGVLGTEFMTYAPGAERVSVVGDFNNWDGRVHQMSRIDDRGVFGIFIPGLSKGTLYKFEVKLLSGLTFLKRDPYAVCIEKGDGDACVVSSENKTDKHAYKRTNTGDRFSVLSVGRDVFADSGRPVSEIADDLISSAKEKSFDMILFPDLTKCDFKNVTDHGTVSFFATNPELISLSELKELTDILHKNSFKVIGTVNPSRFIADNGGLRGYDGTRLFEGNEKEIGDRLNFDFSKPYVRNYLISVCDYYVNELSLDGLTVGGMDRILYLDYGKFDGEWIPNIYGGNENLNGIEFIKHLNSILHKRYPKIITIAKDSFVSNTLTLPLDEGGLGFDYKLHTQFDRDLVKYMERDVRNRSYNHFELTYSPVYIYCERFILSLLNDNYGETAFDLAGRFPFNETDRLKNVRLLTAYMYMHPGRKCLPFYGDNPDKFDLLVSWLNDFYRESAEFLDDDSENGFEWINAIDSEESVVAFIRKHEKEKLLVIANFSDKPVNFRMGLEAGAYKEIFASEQIKFGGEYKLSGRSKQTSKVRCDGKEDSLAVKLAPFCLHVYEKIPCQTKQ